MDQEKRFKSSRSADPADNGGEDELRALYEITPHEGVSFEEFAEAMRRQRAEVAAAATGVKQDMSAAEFCEFMESEFPEYWHAVDPATPIEESRAYFEAAEAENAADWDRMRRGWSLSMVRDLAVAARESAQAGRGRYRAREGRPSGVRRSLRRRARAPAGSKSSDGESDPPGLVGRLLRAVRRWRR